VNPSIPEAAAEFGAAAERAFADLGGVDTARRSETDPDLRSTRVAPTLGALGIDALDPRADLETAAAAGELCRVAGRVVLPYPVAGVLLRDPADGLPFAVVPADVCRVDHGDLFGEWRVAALGGRAHSAVAGSRLGSKLGPFVTDLAVSHPLPRAADADVLLHFTLSAWQILGVVERSIELAVDHVNTRVQFDKPIASFQAVQFQLADAAAASEGLRELAKFTLWRLTASPADALPDVLALRVQALDVARSVTRTTQQLHGAAGMCDEYDISVLCRHVQPALRLPFGAERTTAALVDAVTSHGFDSLFAHGGAGRAGAAT